MSLLSRTERRDDVVFLTTARVEEETKYVEGEKPSIELGINFSSDIKSRDFARNGVLIKPWPNGGVQFVKTRASQAARNSDLRALGYVLDDFQGLKDITARDGTKGLLFTVTHHTSATDTQSLPVMEATFPLRGKGLFPTWELAGLDESSTIQIMIPVDGPESTRSAFQQIIDTISFFQPQGPSE